MKQRDGELLINLTLTEKIERSKEIIRKTLKIYSIDEICIAWTGGKDSTTMLWLYREVCKELGNPLPRAMFIDEGDVFDEIIELVDRVKRKWDVDVAVVKNRDVSDKLKEGNRLIRLADLNERNRQEIQKLGVTEDTFIFEPESYVGNHLMKTVVMNLFIDENGIKAISTAIRWDEQEARTEEEFFSPRSHPDHIRVHPILHFKERDVWDIIHKYDIPFCSLYYHGYRSLGAKGSTTKMSDIPAWEQDLENTSERCGRDQQKEEIMSQLRSLGYM